MNEHGEGITDELIRYLDSHKKIFVTFGVNGNNSMRHLQPSLQLIPQLIESVKFRLPVNGRFYRPDSDYVENESGKFSMHASGFELDMLHFPPYDKFILEYEVGKGTDRWQEGATPEKVVVLCEHLKPLVKQGEPVPDISGIGFKVFEYRSAQVRVEDLIIPAGWATNAVVAITDKRSDRVRSWRDKEYFGLSVGFTNNIGWTSKEGALNAISTMWMEINAILQFNVAISVKHGVQRTEVISKPRKPMTVKGRRLGYTYHVLDIDPDYIDPPPRELGGHHASPGFHLRRGHPRRQPGHTIYAPRITLVKRCFVGDVMRGVIEKDYRVLEMKENE